jgi:hypothetical protein
MSFSLSDVLEIFQSISSKEKQTPPPTDPLPPDAALGTVVPAVDDKLHPLEQMILDEFNTLKPRQQFSIISGYVFNKRDIDKDEVSNETARFELERQKKLLSMKTFLTQAGLIIGCVLAVVLIGVFCFIVLKKGTLSESGVMTGILNTLIEAIKIIFNAPLGN